MRIKIIFELCAMLSLSIFLSASVFSDSKGKEDIDYYKHTYSGFLSTSYTEKPLLLLSDNVKGRYEVRNAENFKLVSSGIMNRWDCNAVLYDDFVLVCNMTGSTKDKRPYRIDHFDSTSYEFESYEIFYVLCEDEPIFITLEEPTESGKPDITKAVQGGKVLWQLEDYRPHDDFMPAYHGDKMWLKKGRSNALVDVYMGKTLLELEDYNLTRNGNNRFAILNKETKNFDKTRTYEVFIVDTNRNKVIYEEEFVYIMGDKPIFPHFKPTANTILRIEVSDSDNLYDKQNIEITQLDKNGEIIFECELRKNLNSYHRFDGYIFHPLNDNLLLVNTDLPESISIVDIRSGIDLWCETGLVSNVVAHKYKVFGDMLVFYVSAKSLGCLNLNTMKHLWTIDCACVRKTIEYNGLKYYFYHYPNDNSFMSTDVTIVVEDVATEKEEPYRYYLTELLLGEYVIPTKYGVVVFPTNFIRQGIRLYKPNIKEPYYNITRFMNLKSTIDYRPDIESFHDDAEILGFKSYFSTIGVGGVELDVICSYELEINTGAISFIEKIENPR